MFASRFLSFAVVAAVLFVGQAQAAPLIATEPGTYLLHNVLQTDEPKYYLQPQFLHVVLPSTPTLISVLPANSPLTVLLLLAVSYSFPWVLVYLSLIK